MIIVKKKINNKIKEKTKSFKLDEKDKVNVNIQFLTNFYVNITSYINITAIITN